MRKKLTEGLADVITSKPNISKSGGFSKNILRPLRHDGQDVEPGRISNRANKSVFSGVSGTKSYHDSNRAFLSMTKQEDKVGKRKRQFRNVTNALGHTVRQGKPIIVKAEKVVVKEVKKVTKIKPQFTKELHRILGGI